MIPIHMELFMQVLADLETMTDAELEQVRLACATLLLSRRRARGEPLELPPG